VQLAQLLLQQLLQQLVHQPVLLQQLKQRGSLPYAPAAA
jgi:hypothetical protein